MEICRNYKHILFDMPVIQYSKVRVRAMVFNTAFNNISVISWWSVLLVEETEYPQKTTDLSQVTDKLYHMMYPVEYTSSERGSNSQR